MNVRIIALGLVAAGAMALGSAALAQNVPSQFVVSGKAAEQILDFTTINLATAERIAEACEKLAAAQGVAISIIVLDNDGNHVYMDRMDGQGYLNIVTAEMKARTALMGRAPSKTRMNRVIQDPTQEFQLIQLGFFPNSGGLPIVVNKQLIGVVGVGGSAPRVPVWTIRRTAGRGPSAATEPQPRHGARTEVRGGGASEVEPVARLRHRCKSGDERLRRQPDFADGREEDRAGLSRLGGSQGRQHVAVHHRHGR